VATSAPKRIATPAPTLSQEEQDDESPLLLTVERAAQKLGICRDFMYRLLAGPHPAMRSVKIGRSRRVPVGELEAYIARRLSEVA
jgi:excisionase family DNA binding protein